MTSYISKLFTLKVDDDLNSIYSISSNNHSLKLTHRDVIEAAILPAIEKITSLVTYCMVQYYSNSCYKPWHTFLMLGNFTNGIDVDLQTNMLHQLLKYEIKRQMVKFCNSNLQFDRSDYSIIEIAGEELCFINNVPLGLYSLTTGITHLHRTFNSTYAIRFYLEGNTAEGLIVHEAGNSARSKKLDLNLLFVFAKEGETLDSLGKGFYIQNNTDKDVYIDFFRFVDTVETESIHATLLSNVKYRLIGTSSFSQEFFKSKEYTACPIFILKTLHASLYFLATDFYITTPLKQINQPWSYRTIEPFAVCYSG